MTTSHKPNVLFWVIGIIGLIWNAMGVFQFFAENFMKETLYEGYTEEQIALMDNMPAWISVIFAIAVFSGFLGCVLLVMRKNTAVALFLISLVAVIIQMSYWLFFTNAKKVMGDGVEYMPITVIVVAAILYFYSKHALKKGWLLK
jgi:magnesium-transporting ATPase (P-type)